MNYHTAGSVRLVATAALVVTFAMIGVLAPVGPAAAFRSLEEGAAAPEFSLTSLGGSTVTLEALKGKRAVLAFVRQGQDKSLAALRSLAELAGSGQQGVEYLAVVSNPEEGDAVAWSKDVNTVLTVLTDKDGEVYGKFGVLVSPATGIFDDAGKLVGVVNGYTASYKDEVEKLVKVSLGLLTAEQAASEPEPEGEAKNEQRILAERHLQKAQILLKRKMRDKAQSSAEEAVSADAEFLDARIFLADLLLDASDDNADAALPHYQKALELAPKSVQAKTGMARVKSIDGQYEEATQILESAVQLNPRPEKVYYELGRVHERAGNYESAAEAYRKALGRLLE